ncbi:MAG TPA: hypothetical protein VME20_11955 [Acidimicrobiales bacterium]|nr:hypothetical protein [Acidimicrobiales bacterium]
MTRSLIAEPTLGPIRAGLETRPHPWAPEHRIPVLRCLHVIFNEEWEHQRYAVRDLARATGG